MTHDSTIYSTPMNTLHTRREFLRSTVLTGALSWTVPAFLANTFSSLQAEAADRATQVVTRRDSSILVVLHLSGGSDGLSTAVPYATAYYQRPRPRTRVAATNV